MAGGIWLGTALSSMGTGTGKRHTDKQSAETQASHTEAYTHTYNEHTQCNSNIVHRLEWGSILCLYLKMAFYFVLTIFLFFVIRYLELKRFKVLLGFMLLLFLIQNVIPSAGNT